MLHLQNTLTGKCKKEYMDNIIQESTPVEQSEPADVESQRDMDFAQMLWSKTVGALFTKAPFDNAFCGKTFLDFLVSLEPQDETEGLLCLRLLSLHNLYLANPEQTNSEINRGNKFMYLFNETLYALNKHKHKAANLAMP